jgi:Protein of unknown function (DUF2652)
MTTATILIPDISGFTEFLTQTEIKHSSHIINELLECIIANNRLGFHLSEVEGDAVLFYKKGDPIPRKTLIEQCIEMYIRFHQQIKIIERDSICRCGACTGVSNLTLKFVAHFGEIQEIKVSNFLKATGADMIVAHRLLKNSIDKHEYLLFSKPLTQSDNTGNLLWMPGQEEYPAIGKVAFEYAYLDVYRLNLEIPSPPQLESVPEPLPKAKMISVDLDVPIDVAYQNLIDTDKRSIWVKGMTTLKHQPITERAGKRHFCETEGLGLDHTVVNTVFSENDMKYIEKVVTRTWKMTAYDHYRVEKIDRNHSRLSLRLAFRKPNLLTTIAERVLLNNVRKDFILFKKMCETS